MILDIFSNMNLMARYFISEPFFIVFMYFKA